MKSLFVCLSVIFLSAPVLAQNLSLRNLLKLREMEVHKVDRKLSKKGWQAVSDSKPTAGIMGKAVWAYNPTPTGEGATAWCVLYYNTTSPSRILYNASGSSTVPKIRKKMRRRKLLPISEGNTLNGVEQLENYADYTDQGYVFRLMQYEQAGFSGVKIFEQSDYRKARENGRL